MEQSVLYVQCESVRVTNVFLKKKKEIGTRYEDD